MGEKGNPALIVSSVEGKNILVRLTPAQSRHMKVDDQGNCFGVALAPNVSNVGSYLRDFARGVRNWAPGAESKKIKKEQDELEEQAISKFNKKQGIAFLKPKSLTLTTLPAGSEVLRVSGDQKRAYICLGNKDNANQNHWRVVVMKGSQVIVLNNQPLAIGQMKTNSQVGGATLWDPKAIAKQMEAERPRNKLRKPQRKG